MRTGICLILLFVLAILQGYCQDDQSPLKKDNDEIILKDKNGLLFPEDELFEADTFSYKIPPFQQYNDTTMEKFNMPVIKPFSTDPMPNFFTVEPGVKYFIRNSMGPDHYIKSDSSGRNVPERRFYKNK
jgi:hypothetical protein